MSYAYGRAPQTRVTPTAADAARSVRPTLKAPAPLPRYNHVSGSPAPSQTPASSSASSSWLAPSSSPSSWRGVSPSETALRSSSNGAFVAPFEGGKSSSMRQLVVDGVADGQEVQVKFCLKYRTSYGQSVKIVGSHPRLGNWDMNKALELKWSEGDRWIATMDLPAGGVYEYKYVLIDHTTQQALAWQGGGNSVLAIQDEDGDVEVEDNWTNSPGAGVSINGETHTRESKLQLWAREMASYKQTAKTASIEISRKNDELQAAKAQVARLKMELSLSSKGKEEVEAKLVEVQHENAMLKSQVAQSQLAMKSTLEEAIKLLAEEMEMEDDDNDDNGNNDGGASSSSEEQPAQRASWASNWRSAVAAYTGADSDNNGSSSPQRSSGDRGSSNNLGNWRQYFGTDMGMPSMGISMASAPSGWRAMFS